MTLAVFPRKSQMTDLRAWLDRAIRDFLTSSLPRPWREWFDAEMVAALDPSSPIDIYLRNVWRDHQQSLVKNADAWVPAFVSAALHDLERLFADVDRLAVEIADVGPFHARCAVRLRERVATEIAGKWLGLSLEALSKNRRRDHWAAAGTAAGMQLTPRLRLPSLLWPTDESWPASRIELLSDVCGLSPVEITEQVQVVADDLAAAVAPIWATLGGEGAPPTLGFDGFLPAGAEGRWAGDRIFMNRDVLLAPFAAPHPALVSAMPTAVWEDALDPCLALLVHDRSAGSILTHEMVHAALPTFAISDDRYVKGLVLLSGPEPDDWIGGTLTIHEAVVETIAREAEVTLIRQTRASIWREPAPSSPAYASWKAPAQGYTDAPALIVALLEGTGLTVTDLVRLPNQFDIITVALTGRPHGPEVLAEILEGHFDSDQSCHRRWLALLSGGADSDALAALA